jgi:hypothetical protein
MGYLKVLANSLGMRKIEHNFDEAPGHSNVGIES